MVQGGPARSKDRSVSCVVQPVSKDRSVSCNGTGWSSQFLRIGPSVVMVQAGPARSKDRSVSCNGTGWSSEI
jgi:hypothetical protein